MRYPKEITKGNVSEDMVMNLDFAPTFLDYAGIEIPADMQGESIRDHWWEEKSDQWRDEIYYHYYEYPKGGMMLKRHYGIRTHRYKLIHYYYDIDEWELFDLETDPNEMNNIYNHSNYQDMVAELKDKLRGLRKKYKDDNEKNFLPEAFIKSIDHLAVGADVVLKFPYAQKYSGGGPNALTDGKISIDDLSQTQEYGVWQGFEGSDLIATIDLKKEFYINQISAGFLQNIDAWIFSPDWVEFSISDDNITFTALGKELRPIPENSTKEERISYSMEVDNINARYIKIVARNIEQCPQWHKGAGNKGLVICWMKLLFSNY